MNNESNTTSCLGVPFAQGPEAPAWPFRLQPVYDIWALDFKPSTFAAISQLLNSLSKDDSTFSSQNIPIFTRLSGKHWDQRFLPTVVFYSMYCTFSAQQWYLPRVWLKCQRWAKHRYLIDDFLALPTKILALVFAVFLSNMYTKHIVI